MPDITGDWSRGIDDSDYNPSTRRVESGYHRRALEQERKRKQELRQQKRKNLKHVGLTIGDLSKEGYRVSDDCNVFTDSSYPVGRINSKGVVVGYDSLDGNSYRYLHAQIESALEFRAYLAKRKIPYLEKPPLSKIIIKLTHRRRQISGLLRLLKGGIN